MARAEVLWQGDPAAACRLEVRFEAGSLEVVRGGGVARLTAGTSGVAVSEESVGGRLVLALSASAERSPIPPHAVLEAPETCDLRVRTRDGSISARGPVKAAFDAETVTGEIIFCVSTPADLALALATSGEISVDFSVSIDYVHHQEPAKHGSVTLGSGACSARLTSRQGAIRALRCSEQATSEPDP